MHAMKGGASLPIVHWKKARELGRLLNKAAQRSRHDLKKIEELQMEQSMAPNLQTYQILVGHYAVRAGELDRVAVLLDEMQSLGVPVHGSIFLAIFKAFSIHGGVRYTPWSKARLESVWTSLARALDLATENVILGKWMVIWVLRAFAKCSGKARTREVWEEIQDRWRPRDGDLAAVKEVLQEVLGT